jgi:hypothetical protein
VVAEQPGRSCLWAIWGKRQCTTLGDISRAPIGQPLEDPLHIVVSGISSVGGESGLCARNFENYTKRVASLYVIGVNPHIGLCLQPCQLYVTYSPPTLLMLDTTVVQGTRAILHHEAMILRARLRP